MSYSILLPDNMIGEGTLLLSSLCLIGRIT
jgi:hypothetical protein